MNYQARLNRVIPGGAHTYSRGFDQFPANAPQILERGEGAYVWAPDGKKYLDYGMALRAVTLGYAHPLVNAAAIREIERGNNLTRASLTELQAAELLVDTIPGADMVKFAKNGSNATTAAAKIARAYTGRRYVCVPRQHPFFSFDDWFIGTTALQRGIPDAHAATTLVFDYNDIQSLRGLFDQHPGEIAAVMLEPATTVTPCAPDCTHLLSYDAPCRSCANTGKNFLHQVQDLCRKDGALLILDEMITGFRWHLQGAQTYFGVEPDMSTFGKGMANGFSVAAVAGKREIMEVGSIDKPGEERTFLLSTTHGGEMCGLGAFIETVRIYKEQDVCRHLWAYGEKLRDGMTQAARECGIADHFMMDGPAICLNYLTRDAEGKPSAKFRTLFSQEMIRHGVLMPWIAVSFAHGENELAMTLEAAKAAMKIYANALTDGIEQYLEGPEIKPVFRRYN
ncbi:glutamate-1-semialdehyde 2,1-aminomutase [Formivibrio citricus]|uniref:Glutamate-1-semialdehyde 2,1-aminomutase n=1 Tax=Formivibrio citricus TaxID=83765 RepID=A0A1I4XW80_9NEIS|nr:glutamate-1-semialdehyde 2,1-aminomutase [Formivibrio citricus]SFN30084.1 glutamate-1-semialdehyde 2,1-aminomutase [Formivibrio citricus]